MKLKLTKLLLFMLIFSSKVSLTSEMEDKSSGAPAIENENSETVNIQRQRYRKQLAEKLAAAKDKEETLNILKQESDALLKDIQEAKLNKRQLENLFWASIEKRK
jgi:DICT domain-containing protein